MTSRGSLSSISGLPLPMASKRDSPAALGNDAVRGDGKSGKDAKARDDRGDKSDKEKGMFGMFKRFGKDGPREEERVPLTFASPSSEGTWIDDCEMTEIHADKRSCVWCLAERRTAWQLVHQSDWRSVARAPVDRVHHRRRDLPSR